MQHTQSRPHLSRGLVWFMAIASGATVANLYYNQPLLNVIGQELHTPARELGLLPTLTQIGYALGMLFIVPLGDSIERRRLTVVCTVLVTLALLGVAAAPSFGLIALMSLVVGLTTVVPQLLIPFAANLAAPEERGSVVGLVMSGLLIGILLSRTLAGLAGAQFGWRAVFYGGAAVMVVFAVLLQLWLPKYPPEHTIGYGELLKSLVVLAREEFSLRLHSFLGAMTFGAFSAFWGTLSLYLAFLPQHYGPRVAGLFGLVGVAGAAIAPLVGRYADKRGDKRMNAAGIAVLIASFVLMYPLGRWLWGMAICVVLLDMGAQANHITNQTRIYALRPNARSRVNTVYMCTYFVGGALGAGLGGWAWNVWHWAGVCTVGALMSTAALVALLWSERMNKLSTPVGEPAA